MHHVKSNLSGGPLPDWFLVYNDEPVGEQGRFTLVLMARAMITIINLIMHEVNPNPNPKHSMHTREKVSHHHFIPGMLMQNQKTNKKKRRNPPIW